MIPSVPHNRGTAPLLLLSGLALATSGCISSDPASDRINVDAIVEHRLGESVDLDALEAGGQPARPPEHAAGGSFCPPASRCFWKLLGLSLIVAMGTRATFRHLDATMPKWMRREMGPDASYGAIYAINPALDLLLVPPLTARGRALGPHFGVIRAGLTVAALSPLVREPRREVGICLKLVQEHLVNLNTEPEGVWRTQFHQGHLIHCSSDNCQLSKSLKPQAKAHASQLHCPLRDSSFKLPRL